MQNGRIEQALFAPHGRLVDLDSVVAVLRLENLPVNAISTVGELFEQFPKGRSRDQIRSRPLTFLNLADYLLAEIPLFDGGLPPHWWFRQIRATILT